MIPALIGHAVALLDAAPVVAQAAVAQAAVVQADLAVRDAQVAVVVAAQVAHAALPRIKTIALRRRLSPRLLPKPRQRTKNSDCAVCADRAVSQRAIALAIRATARRRQPLLA